MVKVLNLENVEFSTKHGLYDGNETYKEGIIYEDEMWILKYFLDEDDSHYYETTNTTEDSNDLKYERSRTALSEFIASNIYSILGYPVQETMLARRYTSLVVICKDFAIEKDFIAMNKLHSLAPFEVLKIEHNLLKPLHIMYDDQIRSYVFHFKNNPVMNKINGITERFWEQSIIDVLINNGDRGTSNWGVLKDENGNMELAPMFDNGNSLPTPITGKTRSEFLNNETLLYTNVLNTVSTYLAVRYKDYFIHNEDLRKAVLKIVPLIEDKLEDIFKFIDTIPEYQYFDDGLKLKVCPIMAKKLYKKQLQIRFDILLKPLYNAVIDYKLNIGVI